MDYVNTKIDYDYSSMHPLRKMINQYMKIKMSENTWRKIKSTFLRQIENEWIMQGGSMLDDYLQMLGQNHIEKIARDMQQKREWYAI